jgi:23S rRNA pseudouridine955/2504/2580 synthase
LELDLITGRTHQILAHLAYIKTPIIGDGKYGDKALRFNKFNNKLFLHAYSVNFKLGNKDYSFKAPLPKHFLEAMEFFGLEFYEETDIRR